ncbi:MAG TPA: ANTAR domain-containing protein [Gaiellaceae bacterium]|nr:ANTAR domain-containing protein [Gaiellaceae bacterium]
MIAILEGKDAGFVREAAKRGLFGYIIDCDPTELQAEIDVVLRRFGEFQNLEGAFGRRAITERAKGILMARHLISEREAFELLRRHSRQTGRKVVDVAAAVVDIHGLLPGQMPAEGSEGSRSHGEATTGRTEPE